MKKRKDFPEWKVTLVYESQEGVCGKLGCNRPLSRGFHRHHIDGDPQNNSLDNLALWCPECHYASFTGPKKGEYERHREQEKKALDDINKLLASAFEGKLSGAHMERMIDAIHLSLRTSRRIAGLDAELEPVPPAIALTIQMQETALIQNSILEGFKLGVKAVTKQLQRP